jgi:predicted transcriptional regulator
MPKVVELSLDNTEMLCTVARALSSPTRIKILQVLNNEGLIIGEIARKLDIPASSAALHIKILEEANLIIVEDQMKTRGSTKLCSQKKDEIFIRLRENSPPVLELHSIEMPVGAFTSCELQPTCGLANEKGVIEIEDTQYCFFSPERFSAGLIWGSAGCVTYTFPNSIPKKSQLEKLTVSMEICSEAPGYKEDWRSDITLWINDTDCGYFSSPGDLGARRGRLTPKFWGGTQYGFLVTWCITHEGTFINDKKVSQTKLEDIHIMASERILLKIGNKADADYIGGFNLFGKAYGDYPQDIILNIEYH